MILKTHPTLDAFRPLKITMDARPIVALDGQVRVAVTKALAIDPFESVSIDGLNR